MAKTVGTKEGGSQSQTVATEIDMTNLQKVLDSNKKWVERKTTGESDFFLKHKPSQSPPYLWVGCSDSRVPPN